MLPVQFTQFPELQTDRLLLRQMVADDAAAVQRLRSGEALYYLPHLTEKPLDAHLKWIEMVNAQIARQELLQWAIALKHEPQLLQGTVCLWNIDVAAKRGELGYHLDASLYRQGIMSEALAEVMAFSKSIGLASLEAFTMPYNHPSIKLLEKLGFVRDLEAEARVSEEELVGNIVFSLSIA